MYNLALPGNPRYQPKQLESIWGYDNLYKQAIRVEWAVMEVLAEIGFMPKEVAVLMTDGLLEKLQSEITTTMVDELERSVTKHDIRALVRLMQERMPEDLRRFVHFPLTSYDVVSTATALQFKKAHSSVVSPMLREVMRQLCIRCEAWAADVQIGRTHGQHAVPITVGFWLSTIVSRMLQVLYSLERASGSLVGKISGPVGAYNAQTFLGVYTEDDVTFEERVLRKLGLTAGLTSTQIVAPEPLSDYLFHCVQMSAVIGQFGRDCRHLMRSEIGELAEGFSKEQVGSSTMAHKRNPVTFESLEGAWQKNSAEFGKVLSTLISEHQRDLVGSSIMRDFPVIVVNLVTQLSSLLRKDKDTGRSFIERILVDTDRCEENLTRAGMQVLAEPLYLALQTGGFKGDAHEFVNRQALEGMQQGGTPFDAAYSTAVRLDLKDVLTALHGVSHEIKEELRRGNASWYTGQSKEIALEVVAETRRYLGVG